MTKLIVLYLQTVILVVMIIICVCSQSDRVEIFWNDKGTGALLLTSTDVDKTGSSYYGKQTLHFLNTKESALVVLGK